MKNGQFFSYVYNLKRMDQNDKKVGCISSLHYNKCFPMISPKISHLPLRVLCYAWSKINTCKQLSSKWGVDYQGDSHTIILVLLCLTIGVRFLVERGTVSFDSLVVVA